MLISGAGSAGLTLAFWLNKFGYSVTVVDTSSGIRKGGSPIEIRGEAIEIIREMKLLKKIQSKRLTENITNLRLRKKSFRKRK